VQITDVPSQSPDSAARVIDDATFVLHGETSELHALNEVGARIWELTDGSRTLADIAAVIQEEYEVDADRAQADVNEFISELVGKQLVVMG
jgi:hypothetical protein